MASSRLLPPLAGLGELKPSQQQQLMAFLQLAGCSVQGGVPGPEDVVSNRKLFSTAYLLVSALAGMEKRQKRSCLGVALLTLWKMWCIEFPPFQAGQGG